jgi:hypothetical protein
MFGDEIEAPPHIFRHAGASKPCGEITGHLFRVKLNAHSSSDSSFVVLVRQSIRSSIKSATIRFDLRGCRLT